jgi:uncharacterized protein YebE (UPF0316 family)
MYQFLESIGISQGIFLYVILPMLIFMARIVDVSIATLRIIFVMSGKKFLAPILGFFESFIWLVAISQIFHNIDNIYSYFAFAGGFAAGTYVGMMIEEKLALGNVVVRIITRRDATALVDHFKEKQFYYTNIPAEGREGKVNILFMVIRRSQLKSIIDTIKQFNPRAFYTVESVRKVRDEEVPTVDTRVHRSRFLGLKRR